MTWNRGVLRLTAALLALACVSVAQEPVRIDMRNGARGKVTAIEGTKLTLEAPDGAKLTVETTDKTEVRRAMDPIKLADVKVGDMVVARGERAESTIKANMVLVVPEGMQMMRQGGPSGPEGHGGGGMFFSSENLGKEFVPGEIKEIDGTRLKIERPDGVVQEVEVDENTSFRKGRESVTFAEFKVGDRVFARGGLKDGLFVATSLSQGRMMMSPGGPGGPGGGNVVMQEKKPN